VEHRRRVTLVGLHPRPPVHEEEVGAAGLRRGLRILRTLLVLEHGDRDLDPSEVRLNDLRERALARVAAADVDDGMASAAATHEPPRRREIGAQREDPPGGVAGDGRRDNPIRGGVAEGVGECAAIERVGNRAPQPRVPEERASGVEDEVIDDRALVEVVPLRERARRP
jgi:hypothetical protein